MNQKQRAAVSKLIDEAERTFLALLDSDLARGEYKPLGRAIEGAKEIMAEAEKKPPPPPKANVTGI